MIDILRAFACLFTTLACQISVPASVPASSVVPVAAVTPAIASSDPAIPREIPREVLKYRNMLIREIRVTWGDAEPLETFFGQVHQESRWRAEAKSKFAFGIAQFTPDTARWIQGIYPADLGEVCPSAAGCPEDPRWALRALVRYDSRLYSSVSGAVAALERWAFALAGYNSGQGWVTRERAVSSDRSRWFGATEHACLRRADFCQETRGYVHAILERWAPMYRSWLLR